MVEILDRGYDAEAGTFVGSYGGKQVDAYGTADALLFNAKREFERNRERYGFLRWGQEAFENFRVVPPETGIVHQVNLEYLARVVMTNQNGWAYPDTLVGTDSHTTMINGIGVLGWGVGGIEAEAAMLGQPVTMLIPQVIGFKLRGELPEGATATDLVLTVTEMLRQKGVGGKSMLGDGFMALDYNDVNNAKNLGLPLHVMPTDVVRGVNQALQVRKMPEKLQGFLDGWHEITQWFKSTTLAIFPAYHGVHEVAADAG